LLEETLAAGYRHFKLKVGSSVEEDKERLEIARGVIGYDKGNVLMVDANQVCIMPCMEATKSGLLTAAPNRSGPSLRPYPT